MSSKERDIQLRESLERLEKEEWWNRPINQTNYDCLDLARIVLLGNWAANELFSRGGQIQDPVSAWFRPYTPSTAMHKKAFLYYGDDTKSAFVKFKGFSSRGLESFKPDHVELMVNGSYRWQNGPTENWLERKFRPQKNGRGNMPMVCVVKPTGPHFENEEPISVIASLSNNQVPEEVVRQIVWRIVTCRGGKIAAYYQEALDEKLTSKLPDFPLRFQRQKVSQRENWLRQRLTHLLWCKSVSMSDLSGEQKREANLIKALDQVRKDQRQSRNKVVKVEAAIVEAFTAHFRPGPLPTPVGEEKS